MKCISAHLIANRDLIQDYYEDFEQYRTGSGETLPPFGKGTLPMSLDHGTLTLLDVLYAPDLGYNLISTMLHGRKDVETYLRTSDPASQLLYKSNVLGYADPTNEQYVVRIKPTPVTNATKTGRRSEQPTKARPVHFGIWHERMAHLGYQNLQKLKETAIGVEFQGAIPEEICEGCMAGRQHRCISRIPGEVCTEFLVEVHSDIAGPYPPTRQGHRYYQSIVERSISTGVSIGFAMR